MSDLQWVARQINERTRLLKRRAQCLARLAVIDRSIAKLARKARCSLLPAFLLAFIFMAGLRGLAGETPSPFGGMATASLPADAAGALPEPHSYQAIGWLVVGIAAVVTIAGKAVELVGMLRGKRDETVGISGQPVGIEMRSPCATRAELEALRAEHHALAARVEAHYHELFVEGQHREERLRSDINAANAENEQRAIALHERINPLAENVATITGILRGAKVERTLR